MYPNFNDQADFRLNRINEIKEYFTAEIQEFQKLVMVKKC